jgi:DNA mismatch repair protein MutS
LFSIGYTVILSQIGCFVPADNVNIDLFDALVSKVQLHENIEMNMSRFQLTITHFSNIVENCTTNS